MVLLSMLMIMEVFPLFGVFDFGFGLAHHCETFIFQLLYLLLLELTGLLA